MKKSLIFFAFLSFIVIFWQNYLFIIYHLATILGAWLCKNTNKSASAAK